MDPQGNSTSGVGIDKSWIRVGIYDVVVGGEPAAGTIMRTGVGGMDIIPTDVRLAGAEVELVSQIARETKLRVGISQVSNSYDFVLVDCPPSLGLLTVNGLAAAEACLIPLQCEFYALEGLAQLMETITLVRRHLNHELRIAGIVLTMVDQRTKLSAQVAADVRAHFPDLVFATEVPRSIRLAEAPSYGQPVLSYAPSSRGAEAYLALARELLDRLGLPRQDAGPQSDASAAQVVSRPGPSGRGDPEYGEEDWAGG